ncbi:Pentatricopeptide repeat [Macleaya cordata]|uniref:Pentatricopeptide repeat n=1 Tax=Macleaya cordata TaxID=56857 RepID=A0A200QC68_MACCD|nr:Pentatricopeptide repeat [Macleaya cordata]
MDLKHLIGALRHCGRIRASRHGKSLHCHSIRLGYSQDVFVANNLISMYTDFSLLDDARNLFDEMAERNVVTWTTMISAYTCNGSPLEALRLFNVMVEFELETPNRFTFSAALKACAVVGDLEMGKLIHRSVSKANLQFDTVLMNTLLDMYVKCKSLTDARQVFDLILSKNSNSWNTIIAGYAKEGQMEEAVNLFCRMPVPDTVSWNTVIAGFAIDDSSRALEFVHKMHRDCVKLDQFTFPSALKSCGCLNSLTMGKEIHSYVIKSGFGSCCFTISGLLDMYGKCGEVDEATELFDEYSSGKGSIHDNLGLWNSMLSAYALNEVNGAALDLVSQIHRAGVPLDFYTFSGVLKVCINLLNWRLGLQIHGLIVTSGYELDYIVGSILIDFYAKHGNLKDAFGLFQRLPKKDIVAWAGLIAVCAKKGSNHLVFSLFRDMVFLDLEVDHFVVSSVLKACSTLGGLQSGEQVHAYCVKSGYKSEGITVTSLIDMYSKCGEIGKALTLFSGMNERDTVCWTGIISGCGQNGRAKEALEFFQEMIKSGGKPNEITFLGVLSACRHAGLVKEALLFFRCMAVEHELEPQFEHYCCMVDLLGRAGYFTEAEKLIADSPFQTDQTLWSPLLWTCGINNNIEHGNRIARYIVSVTPRDLSVYVTLANVYASLGMWKDSTEVREVIKEMGTKEMGKSWIERKCPILVCLRNKNYFDGCYDCWTRTMQAILKFSSSTAQSGLELSS